MRGGMGEENYGTAGMKMKEPGRDAIGIRQPFKSRSSRLDFTTKAIYRQVMSHVDPFDSHDMKNETFGGYWPECHSGVRLDPF